MTTRHTRGGAQTATTAGARAIGFTHAHHSTANLQTALALALSLAGQCNGALVNQAGLAAVPLRSDARYAGHHPRQAWRRTGWISVPYSTTIGYAATQGPGPDSWQGLDGDCLCHPGF
jgi:hypothetical protein